MESNDRLLTREEAANYLGGLQPQTLAKWSCSGAYGLPYIKVGGSVRYRISDLEKFLAARTVNAPAATAAE